MIQEYTTVFEKEVEQLVDTAFKPYKAIYTIKPSTTKNSTFKYNTILCVEESKLIGTLSYYIDKDILRLFKVAIDPGYQGKGYFTKLLNHVVEYSKSRSICKLGLYTIKETNNFTFFHKRGFKIVSESIANFAIGVDGNPIYELDMIKRI